MKTTLHDGGVWRPDQAGGTVDMFARELIYLAEGAGEVVKGEFNGTPMRACPGSHVSDVLDNWSLRRRLIQAGLPAYDN